MAVSMSRKGTCWYNAVMERFFGFLKSKWVRVSATGPATKPPSSGRHCSVHREGVQQQPAPLNPGIHHVPWEQKMAAAA